MTGFGAPAPAKSQSPRDVDGPRFTPCPTNRLLLVLHVAVAMVQFFVLPLFLLPLDIAWALILLPLALFNNPLWSLIHETVHGTFDSHPAQNRAAGRVLAVCYGAPWRILRTGHLLHHRFNRSPLERPEIYNPGETRWPVAAGKYYFQLFVGLYLTQILSPIAFFLPLRTMRWARRRFVAPDSYNGYAATTLLRPRCVREVRIDGAAILAVLCLSAFAYGAHLWMLGLVLLTRGVCISFLDYIYHYASRTDDTASAYNLSLPAAAQKMLLNFNLHAIHHRHPQAPWHQLPALFENNGDRFSGTYVHFALRQMRGPVPRTYRDASWT